MQKCQWAVSNAAAEPEVATNKAAMVRSSHTSAKNQVARRERISAAAETLPLLKGAARANALVNIFTTRRGLSWQNANPAATRSITRALSAAERDVLRKHYKDLDVPAMRQRFRAGQETARAATRLRIDEWERAARQKGEMNYSKKNKTQDLTAKQGKNVLVSCIKNTEELGVQTDVKHDAFEQVCITNV